jgi:orotate phosphoribosyltransferase
MSNPEALLFDLSKKINPVDSKNAVIFVAGNIGFDFFDVTKLALSPVTSGKVCEIYKNMLREIEDSGIEYDKLAFIDKIYGTLVFASQLSIHTQKEAVIIKTRVPCDCKLCTSQLRIKGSNKPQDFPVSQNERVVIVSDVLTTGGTIQKAIDIIQQHQGKVVATLVVVDRQMIVENNQTAKEWLEEKNIDLKVFSLTTRDRLLSWGFSEPTLEDLQNKEFMELIKDSMDQSDRSTYELEKNISRAYVDGLISSRKDKNLEEDRRLLENMAIALVMHTLNQQLLTES